METLQNHRGVSAKEAVADFRLACLSRALDDREIALNKQDKVFFQISGAGHEALYLGLARSLRPGYDWFFPYYRDRALMLGLGVTAYELMLAAVGSAADPCSGGRQMPCHWSFPKLNVVTQSSAVGTQCLPAVGCAEAGRYIVRRNLEGTKARGDELVYVSIGEGGTSEGEFWESLNTACREFLPVLYVVADNGYAISVRADEQAPAPVSELVAGFRGLNVVMLDGRDYFEVRSAMPEVLARVRAGEGPALVHARVTRPYSHSYSDDQRKYRTAQDLAQEREHDPIETMERSLIEGGVLTAEEAQAIRNEARQTAVQAADDALRARRPDPASVLEHVLGPAPAASSDIEDGSGEVVTMADAIRKALRDEMAADERIRVFGEDVADSSDDHTAKLVAGKGGVFGITRGLQREFGHARVFNTPLAEANIIGRGVGMALRGLRPCVEVQFFDYIYPAMSQIKSEAATIRWRSNGAWSVPLVIRAPIGGYLSGGAIWHSQCGESIFAHIPGLLIAFPSRARDAAGLLRTALRYDDPVMFLEHKHLYRQVYNRDPYPDPSLAIPFGQGSYVARGDDVTVVTWGATVRKSQQAAQTLGSEGISVEIIDLRTIVPWDQQIVAESVGKTSRVIVVHEDIVFAGFGAEIAAWIADEMFGDLDAPVRRFGAANAHVPYEPTLEAAVLPQVPQIADAIRALALY